MLWLIGTFPRSLLNLSVEMFPTSVKCTLFRAISKQVRRKFKGWEIPLISNIDLMLLTNANCSAALMTRGAFSHHFH